MEMLSVVDEGSRDQDRFREEDKVALPDGMRLAVRPASSTR